MNLVVSIIYILILWVGVGLMLSVVSDNTEALNKLTHEIHLLDELRAPAIQKDRIIQDDENMCIGKIVSKEEAEEYSKRKSEEYAENYSQVSIDSLDF